MRSIFLHNKLIFYSVVLVLLITLILLAKIAFTPIDNLSAETVLPTPILTPKIVTSCAQFPTDKGEISCEEAEKIALKAYPGQLLSIDKTILPYESGKPPNTQTEERKIWSINIKPDDLSLIPVPLKDPKSKETQILESIGVAIDRSSKEILFFELFFKK